MREACKKIAWKKRTQYLAHLSSMPDLFPQHGDVDLVPLIAKMHFRGVLAIRMHVDRDPRGIVSSRRIHELPLMALK